ncbi:MAG: PAS domain S-box protein [Nitrospirota bacterium]
MVIPLRVLIVEDSEDDALLIVRELKRGGYETEFVRVANARSMKEALSTHIWDVVISDYAMPDFSGPGALQTLRETCFDLPFILVTGAISEEEAVEVMKAGAHDCVMKNNLVRLVPAVTRELREAKIRHERRLALEALRQSEDRYRTIFENTGTATIIFAEDMTILLANKECERLSGYSREEIEGKKKWTEFVAREDLERLMGYHFLRSSDPDSAPPSYEFRCVNRTGGMRDVLLTIALIPGTKNRVASLLDLTERKRIEKELTDRIKQLEDFYDMAVGRELRMIELKEKIKELRQEIETFKPLKDKPD